MEGFPSSVTLRFATIAFFSFILRGMAFMTPNSAPKFLTASKATTFIKDSHVVVSQKMKLSSSSLNMAKISSDEVNSSTVGIVGRGFISYLTAKLSANAGYNTWMLYPPSELETIEKLVSTDNELPKNLEFVSIADGDYVGEKLKDTNALIFAADDPDNGIVDSAIINFMINEETMASKSLKRVAVMSRNLNGKGLGFFAKAAKASANREIWTGDDKQIKLFQAFENQIKEAVQKTCGDDTDVTIVRAGTLKGGACGDAESEEYFPQFLSPYFYEITKKDIITWQFLFDCNVRGVKLFKGDSMPGPGGKAILTATAPEACEGDSPRCGVADALVRSLQAEKAGEFAVGTVESRSPPTDAEWEELLQGVLA